MPTDDQNPGLGGAGEAVDTTEPQEPQTPQEPSSDPLDAIQDPVAREEAKKHRAIARRLEKKPELQTPTAPLPATNVATKEDLGVLVTNQAKELSSAEVREHWDALLSIPLEGYNALDARSIAQNMSERLAIFKTRQAAPDPAKDLATSSGERGTSGKAPETKKGSNIPRPLSVDDQAERLYGKS